MQFKFSCCNIFRNLLISRLNHRPYSTLYHLYIFITRLLYSLPSCCINLTLRIISCVQYQGCTAIYVAAKNGDVKITRALVEAGADLNITNKVSRMSSQTDYC